MMTTAEEINAIYLAMRLISHKVNISQLLNDRGEFLSEEYSVGERKLALQIIENIQRAEEVSIAGLSESKTEQYLSSLADKVEDLSNKELIDSNFNIEEGGIILEILRRLTETGPHMERELLWSQVNINKEQLKQADVGTVDWHFSKSKRRSSGAEEKMP
jgi:hypothetical protein